MRTTTFEEVPVGELFLLGSPQSRRAMMTFKKVEESFALSEDYKGNKTYFYPGQQVHIQHRRK
ncbi:MAG: hypothetical protein PVH03_06395 [Chloroflexota bacterium]